MFHCQHGQLFPERWGSCCVPLGAQEGTLAGGRGFQWPWGLTGVSMTQWAGGVVLAPLAGGGGLGAGKFLELVVGLLSSLLGWTPPPWSQRCDGALLPGGGSTPPPATAPRRPMPTASCCEPTQDPASLG